MLYEKINPIYAYTTFFRVTPFVSTYTLTHSAMVALLSNRTEHFDVVLVDIFMADALLGLGQHFGAPIIALSSYPTKSISLLVGSPITMSYMPNLLVGFTDRMLVLQPNTRNDLRPSVCVHRQADIPRGPGESGSGFAQSALCHKRAEATHAEHDRNRRHSH